MIVKNWFGHQWGILHLRIKEFERTVAGRESHRANVRIFEFMDLKQPLLSPKLDDHLIAAAIEEESEKGNLVKMPEARLSDGYSGKIGQPAELEYWSILYNMNSSEGRGREEQAEEERCCIENHALEVR